MRLSLHGGTQGWIIRCWVVLGVEGEPGMDRAGAMGEITEITGGRCWGIDRSMHNENVHLGELFL